MLKISDLSAEELNQIIDNMDDDFLKFSINSNREGYERFITGMRPQALSSQLDLVRRRLKGNHKNRFVQDVIYTFSNGCVECVNKEKDLIVKKGVSEDKAFIMATVNVVKPEFFEVFFKISEYQVSAQLMACIKLYSDMQKDRNRLAAEFDDIKHKNLEEAIKDSKSTISDLERVNKDLSDEISLINNELILVKEENSRLKQSVNERISRRIEPEPAYITELQENQVISLCVVSNNGMDIWLNRIADIYNNMIRPFIPLEGERRFENRDRLYYREGPDKDNSYGIWDWTYTENYNNPQTDYIFTKYTGNCVPVEIIFCNNISSLNELIGSLKKGVIHSGVFGRSLCVYRKNKEFYEGILLDKSEINSTDYSFVLKDNISLIKKYSIKASDIITFQNYNLSFYRYINLPIEGEILLISSPLEITKKLLLERASWTVGKKVGFDNRIWQSIKNYISQLPTDDLYSEISQKCLCTVEDAKGYLNELVDRASDIISGKEITSEILTSIVRGNSELFNCCCDNVRQEWERNNQDLISSEKAKLDAVCKEVAAKHNEVERIEQKHSMLVKEINEVEQKLTKKEAVAAAVENKIADKIKTARQDAADFIAEMAFVTPGFNLQNDNHEKGELFSGGNLVTDIEVEEYASDKTLVEEIVTDALRSAGIERNYRLRFAAFLFAAHKLNIPLMLSGVNAFEIANAYSVALYGKYATVFDCSTEYSSKKLNELQTCESDILIIKNIIGSTWLNYFDDLIKTKAYPFIICPFSDDLLIEPRGLWDYVVPVITSVLVDNKVKRFSIAGKKSETQYKNIGFADNERKSSDFVSSYLDITHANRMLCFNLSNIFVYLSQILSSNDNDMDILCGYLPYLYVSQKGFKIEDTLKRLKNNLSKEKIDQIKDFLGVEDEIV